MLEKFTKSTQATGPENTGPERTLPGLVPPTPVNSPTRITLENNGKFWPQPGREKLSSRATGGGNGSSNKLSLVPMATAKDCREILRISKGQ